MTFQDFAANETTAAIERLLARRSDESAQHLRALRDAVDRATRALDEAVPPSDDIQELTGRLGSAFATAASGIRQEAQATIDEIRAQLAAVRAEADAEQAAAATRIEELESASAAGHAAAQFEAQVRTAVEAELRECRSLLDRAASDVAVRDARLDGLVQAEIGLRQELATAAAAREQLARERAGADERAEQEARARAAAEQELQHLRADLEAAFDDIARLGARLEAGAADRGRLVSELSAAQNELETARVQHEAAAAQLRAQVARVQTLERAHARQEELIRQLQARLDSGPSPDTPDRPLDADPQPVADEPDADDLLTMLEASERGMDTLAAAGTIADLFSALTQQLSTRFARVALFRVKGKRLAGDTQIGFDHNTYVRKMVIPLSVDTMLTRVAATGHVERLSAADLADEGRGAPFRGMPSTAVALPIDVRGETIAVVYADDGPQGSAAQDPGACDVNVRLATLLARQASSRLLGLTHELRVLEELREYATSLVAGAEQIYLADAETRRPADELRRRLQDNLECARQLFAQRASLEAASAEGLLEEQIAALIGSRDDDPFARDLAALVGTPYAAPPRSAEAS